MRKEILTKKIILLLCVFVCFAGKAQSLSDSVIMTVAGKPIPLSEFLFIAQKNGEADLSNAKSIENYLELFKNFKLKVAEAEALGMDKTQAFVDELEGYRGQLVAGFLSDKEAEESAARVLYDRGNELLEVSYILFRMPPERTLKNDTIIPYQEVMSVYERVQRGEDLDAIGKQLAEQDPEHEKYVYQHLPYLPLMVSFKVLEKAFYDMPVGKVSQPIFTSRGYYLLKVHRRIPNPGKVRAAHILIGFSPDSLKQEGDMRTREEALALAREILQKAKSGEDFAQLAKTFSKDSVSGRDGGLLRPFGLGEMVSPFEQAAFSLTTPGEVSDVIESRFGFHIIKLIERLPRPSFEAEKRTIMKEMARGEYNFDLYKSFDDRMRKEYNYVFYPEAYQEMLDLTSEHFPSDYSYYDIAQHWKKTLFTLDGEEFPQNEFAVYMVKQPFSTKTYAPEFMQEVYNLFIRELTTNAERKSLEQKYPEYLYLMQEYRDGILLFEVSNQKVWSKPLEEQEAIEAEWIKELNKKYPVVINKKLLKQLQKGNKK